MPLLFGQPVSQRGERPAGAPLAWGNFQVCLSPAVTRLWLAGSTTARGRTMK